MSLKWAAPAGVLVAAAMPMKKRRVNTPINEELSKYSETELLYKSNLFRLQTAELVREVVPKQSTELEAAVRALRAEMMALPPAELAWESSAANVDALPIVSHPELAHLRLVNSRMSLSWRAPEHVELVGSYLLRTVARPSLNVDVAVRIPQTSFLHKDYLDHRYADKRMLYLGYLGGQLLKSRAGTNGEAGRRVSFVWLPHLQDRRWPVLQLTLPGLAGGWTIRLVPSLAPDAFPPAKLVPDRSNLRDRTLLAASAQFPTAEGPGFDRAASPEYNNRLALESAYGPALRLLHAAYSADAEGTLQEATIMLKVWLRQRCTHQAGGVCGFQLSLLLVHLLSERVLSHSMGAYHIFRVALTHLSKNSLDAAPIVLPSPHAAPAATAQNGRGLQPAADPSLRASAASKFGRHFAWVLTDSSLSANYGAGVTRGALRELRAAAARSIAAIDSAALDDAISFSELFMRPQPSFLRYDALFSWELPITDGPSGAHYVAQAERAAQAAAAALQAASESPTESEPGGGEQAVSVEDKRLAPVSEDVALATAAAAEAVLSAGLTRRARLVRCWHDPLPERELNLHDPPTSSGGGAGGVSRTHAGVLLEPAVAARPVERGPVPGSPAAAAWIGLWGEKSETRRFRDGAVVHAVVWEADEMSRHLIPAQAVRCLTAAHGSLPFSPL
jgi:U3 small nucleolar RNA-associated protein 22